MANPLFDAQTPAPAAPPPAAPQSGGGNPLFVQHPPFPGHQPTAANAMLAHPRGGRFAINPAAAKAQATAAIGTAGLLGRVLDAQRYGLAKTITGKTLPDEQRAAYRAGIGLPSDAAAWAKVPGILRGPLDVALDTFTDPLTAETAGFGIIPELGARAAGPLSRIAGRAIERLPVEGQEAARFIGKLPEYAARPFRPGTTAQAALPRAQRDVVLGAKSQGSAEGRELGRRFTTRLDKLAKGVSPDDEREAYRALNGEVPFASLSASARTYFDGLRKLQDEAKYVNATPQLQRLISMRHGGIVRPTGVAPRRINVPQTTNTFNDAKVGTNAESTEAMARSEATTTARANEFNRLAKAEGVKDPFSDNAFKARFQAHWQELGDDGREALVQAVYQPPKVLPEHVGALSPLQRRGGVATAERPTGLKVTKRANVRPLALSPEIAKFPQIPGENTAYRYRYLPFPAEANVAPKAARTVNPLNYRSPNELEREDALVGEQDPATFRNAFQSMLTNSGRDYAASRTAQAVKNRFGGSVPLAVEDALAEHIPGEAGARTPREVGSNLWRKALGYGRSAIVGLTPFHTLNIGSLLLGHDPSGRSLGRTLAQLPKALLESPEARYERTGLGRAMGAIAPFSERSAPFSRLPLALRSGGGAAFGAGTGYFSDPNRTQKERMARALIGAAAGAAGGAALPAWTRAMSHIVWTADDVAKNELARTYLHKTQRDYIRGALSSLKAAGFKGDEAKRIAEHMAADRAGFGPGRRAAEDLIDYANPSDFGRMLQFISRFPNYRSQLVPSVLRAVAKNPAGVEAVNRASGGMFLGGDVHDPLDKTKSDRSYTAVADVGRGVGDPAGFVRSTLGDPVKTAASLAQVVLQPLQTRRPFYFTYGMHPGSKQWLLGMALAGLPESQAALSALDLGRFGQESLADEGLFQATGIARRSTTSDASKARSNMIRGAYQSAISLAKKAGDTEMVDKLTAERDATIARLTGQGSAQHAPAQPTAPVALTTSAPAPTAATTSGTNPLGL